VFGAQGLQWLVLIRKLKSFKLSGARPNCLQELLYDHRLALRDGTGATRNDGRTKKRRERRCSVERLARTRACGDRVAKKWRAGGGEAEKIRAVVRAFAYWRLRIGATFSACSTHQCRALLRHHRVANQP